MKPIRIAALLWLIGLASAAGYIALFRNGSVESHELARALQPGFDAFGRDCLLLTLAAAWKSLGLLLPMAALLTGVSFLFVFGRFLAGNRGEFLFRSILDSVSSLPGLLIALALSAFFEGQRSGFTIACVIGVVPYLIRYFEGQVADLQTRSYYRSTISVGASPAYLYRRYVIPELLAATASIFPFLMTRLILIETSLSFLGLQSPVAGETWGRLLYQGKDYLLEAPWIIAAVGAPLFLTLLAFHLLSDPERT